MSFKVTKGRKSRYKGQNRSDFDLNKNKQIMHENEALYVIFSKKIISRSKRSLEVKNLRKKSKTVKFGFSTKVDKLYVKLKLSTSVIITK